MKRIGTNPDSEGKYQRALQRVKKLKDFYSHLTIYLIFVCVFVWLNLHSSSFPWAIFPIAGWGIGVLGHAADTFGYNIFFGKDWEQRKIREFMDEEDEVRF